MPFTELYCDFATGANINAGDDKAVVTEANGAWSTVTNIFVAVAGTPFSGVTVGDFASLYLDGGTVSVYVARVTAVNGGGATLTLDTTAIAGVAPTTAATGVTCTVGGKWKGPNAAENFPFNFATTTLKNVAGDTPRVNLKNTAPYVVTAAIAHSLVGPIHFEGYTTTVGDGGRAVIDGGTSGASYALFTASGASGVYVGMTFQHNGATGSADGVVSSGAENTFLGCVVNTVCGRGFSMTGTNTVLSECEAYAVNANNTSGCHGFEVTGTGGTLLVRCISHDNPAATSHGFRCSNTATFIRCIADTNGLDGFNSAAGNLATFISCEAYNNTSDGIELSNLSIGPFYIENCNLVKNGGWGINGSGAGARTGAVYNCGFGAGTQVNGLGATTGLKSMIEVGTVTYAADVTPWVAPATGDFRIGLAAAIGTGRGTFTETAASYTGTVGNPVIGAAQVADYPDPADVADGTEYANGAYVGTDTSPPAGSVLPGRIPAATASPLPGRVY